MIFKNLNIFFFRFVTIHAFDGQTDRQIDRQTDSLVHMVIYTYFSNS